MIPRVRSIISRLLIVLLALGASVVAASFWPGAYEKLDGLWPSQVPESALSLPPGTFTPIRSKGGDWYTAAGCIHDEFYLARDGSEVSFSHTDTSSPALAAEQMQKSIKLLYEAQEAGSSAVLDGSGMKVGERVTGLRRIDTQGQNRVAVLWTEGSELFTIEGASLENVHEFELHKVKR
jgi:hypothetical protein